MLYKTADYILLSIDQTEIEESISSNLIQSVVGRTLLVNCLKEIGIYKDYPIYKYGKYGKPYLSNYSGWYFNISHCSQSVVCVLSQKEIGVDVEFLDEKNMDLIEVVLNNEEAHDVLTSNDSIRMFYKYWTKKESLLKCSGRGISDNLKEILLQDKYEFYHISKDKYEMCICTYK